MSNIADIKSGSIFEAPLDKDFGYAYIKAVFLNDIDKDNSYKSLIVRVYDLVSTRKSEVFKKSFFETDNILFFPWILAGYPPLRGPKKWHIVGQSDLTLEDQTVPDYLWRREDDNEDILRLKANGQYGLGFKRNFKDKDLHSNNYENVRHLGTWLHRTSSAIIQVLTMHQAKKLGQSLKDIYTLEELNNNFWLKYNWNELLNESMEFKSLPRIIRLRAIE